MQQSYPEVGAGAEPRQVLQMEKSRGVPSLDGIIKKGSSKEVSSELSLEGHRAATLKAQQELLPEVPQSAAGASKRNEAPVTTGWCTREMSCQGGAGEVVGAGTGLGHA